jgi:hypothetical protein
MDVAGQAQMPLSYNQMGTRPRSGPANRFVREMEAQHARDAKKWEKKSDATK